MEDWRTTLWLSACLFFCS